MLNHESYINISAFQNKYVDGFRVGDIIAIQEKLDGANASFQYDEENDSLISFSRRNTLTDKDTLRGFKTMVDSLDKSKFQEYPQYRFYGEWLVKHTIVYPQECYGKFYLFDIYDIDEQKWLYNAYVELIANELNLLTVPTFYLGEFISWEHISEFIGATALGGDSGEGVVIKNMSRINDSNNKLPFYTKLVTSNFKEKMKTKIKEPLNNDELAKIEYDINLTATIVTKARVRKMLHNLVDDGILEVDWGIEDMEIIAKNLTRRVYHDCIKEESDIVNKISGNFGKLCNKISMRLAKEIALEIGSNIEG